MKKEIKCVKMTKIWLIVLKFFELNNEIKEQRNLKFNQNSDTMIMVVFKYGWG